MKADFKIDSYIIKYQKYLINNNHIHYYRINSENIDQKYFANLSLAEQNKAQLYKSIIDKNRYIIRHLLLKKILKTDNQEFYYDSYGKLCLMDSKINFSLSISNNDFITAITDKDHIGIDIEEIKMIENYQKMFSLFLTKTEIQLINRHNDKLNLFYAFWTAKEAFIKAIGLGMNFNLHDIEFALDQKQQLFVKSVNYQNINTAQILLNQFTIDNLFVSLVEIPA